MPLTLIIQRVQTIFDDLGERWCDKDYVVGWLAINNEDVELELAAWDLSYQEDYVILPAVPADTVDLSSYQQTGGALDSMMTPISVEWRLVGENDEQWRPIPKVDKLIDTNQEPGNAMPLLVASQVVGIESWQWRRGRICISPSSEATDIRVYADMLPDVFESDSDTYIKGLTNVLVYATAESIASQRGGPKMQQLATWCHARYVKVCDLVVSINNKQDQAIQRRLGGRRSRRQNIPGWTTPVV